MYYVVVLYINLFLCYIMVFKIVMLIFNFFGYLFVVWGLREIKFDFILFELVFIICSCIKLFFSECIVE